jgi:hypothetical protein
MALNFRFQNEFDKGTAASLNMSTDWWNNDNISYSGATIRLNPLIHFDSPVTLPDGTVVRGGDIPIQRSSHNANTFVSHQITWTFLWNGLYGHQTYP